MEWLTNPTLLRCALLGLFFVVVLMLSIWYIGHKHSQESVRRADMLRRDGQIPDDNS